MIVEVIINGFAIRQQSVDGSTAMAVATWLYGSYHIDELKECDISASVEIAEIQSKMNDENFLIRPEVYDELYFKELAL